MIDLVIVTPDRKPANFFVVDQSGQINMRINVCKDVVVGLHLTVVDAFIGFRTTE